MIKENKSDVSAGNASRRDRSGKKMLYQFEVRTGQQYLVACRVVLAKNLTCEDAKVASRNVPIIPAQAPADSGFCAAKRACRHHPHISTEFKYNVLQSWTPSLLRYFLLSF